MSYLVDLDDVLQTLVDCDTIKGTAYVSLENMLKDLPVKAILRECDGCMGASMGDCAKCERVKLL